MWRFFVNASRYHRTRGDTSPGRGYAVGKRTVNVEPCPAPSLATSRAVVPLDEVPDQGQADAEAAVRARCRAIDLPERLERARGFVN